MHGDKGEQTCLVRVGLFPTGDGGGCGSGGISATKLSMYWCQDRSSRSEMDADGGMKVLGERVGSGSYYSRVVRVEAKRVRVDE